MSQQGTNNGSALGAGSVTNRYGQNKPFTLGDYQPWQQVSGYQQQQQMPSQQSSDPRGLLASNIPSTAPPLPDGNAGQFPGQPIGEGGTTFAQPQTAPQQTAPTPHMQRGGTGAGPFGGGAPLQSFPGTGGNSPGVQAIPGINSTAQYIAAMGAAPSGGLTAQDFSNFYANNPNLPVYTSTGLNWSPTSAGAQALGTFDPYNTSWLSGFTPNGALGG